MYISLAIALCMAFAPSLTARYAGGVQTYVMPMAADPIAPGRYSQVQSRSLADPLPVEYAYTPSNDIRALAKKHMTLVGLSPKTWFEFVPPSAGEQAPIVILAHGAGREGLSGLDMWKDTAVKNGLALIAPKAGQEHWPYAKPEPDYLVQILSAFSKLHPSDPERVYLFDHSSRAICAKISLNRTQGPWLTAVLHAGFAPAKVLIAPASPKPVKLYPGDQDHMFSMAAARLSGKASAAQGQDFDLVQIRGHTHWFYAAGPKIAANSWAWMSAISRLMQSASILD